MGGRRRAPPGPRPRPRVGLEAERSLLLHAAVYQDNTDSTTTNLGHLSADHLLWLAEFVVSPAPAGRQGNYRFLAYYREAGG